MDANGGYIDPNQSSSGSGYRQRVEKRQREKLRIAHVVHTVLFCGVLFYFGVLSLILPKGERSELEKRELAKMPEFSTDALVEGSYTKDLELHYADTFPFRDWFVSVAAKIDELRGIRFDGVRIHHGVTPGAEAEPVTEQPPHTPDPGPKDSPAVVTPTQLGASGLQLGASGEAVQPHTVVDDGATGEQQGAVFVYKDKAMSIFGGGTGSAERYAGVITKYKETWGDSVNVYNIVVPTAIEFSLPERYKGVSAPQLPNIRHIYGSLGEGVIPVDAYGAIETHAGEYLYFNSDHHWTALGAYYVYRDYAQRAGLTPLELDEFERKSIAGFKGTMHAQTNDAKLAVDRVDYYLPPVEHTAIRIDRGLPDTEKDHSIFAEYAKGIYSYSVFLHGDFPLIRATTDVKNGRKALVVKESFGNAFAPFLLSHYEQVHIVDLRYLEKNLVDYVKNNGIQDVIFINNIFAANTGYHIGKIETMMNPPPPVVEPVPAPQPAAGETEANGEPAGDVPADGEAPAVEADAAADDDSGESAPAPEEKTPPGDENRENTGGTE